GVTWVASTSLKFTSNGDVQRQGNDGNNVAHVPVSFGDKPVLYLAAHITSLDSNEQANFTALGFASSTSQGAYWGGSGGAEIWMYVAANGRYEVYADGTNINLAANHTPGSAPGYVAGQPMFYELIYDRATNIATAKINGTVVVSKSLGDYEPNIG